MTILIKVHACDANYIILLHYGLFLLQYDRIPIMYQYYLSNYTTDLMQCRTHK